jgi:hypothetical protein
VAEHAVIELAVAHAGDISRFLGRMRSSSSTNVMFL